MSLSNIRDMVDAENNGQYWFTTWRKTPTQSSSASIWFDLSMSPGNPVPNYYAAAPNVAIALKQSTDGGIAHGGAAPAGMRKYLKSFMAMSNSASVVPLPMMMLDYLIFYPFIDMSTTDEQFLDNTVTIPRSVSGKGVQIMPVEVAGQTGVGNPKFRISYTNSDGVAGRITPDVACNTAVAIGTLISSSQQYVPQGAGPFVTLQAGDTGVRSIESITFVSADVGLVALVLVKPVENMVIRTNDAPAERTFITDFSKLAVIEDDAYLNLICCPQFSLGNAPIHGTATFIWG